MKNLFKMMLAGVLFFSATLSANAQFSRKENNRVPDRFHMGIRAGITSNTYTGDFDYKSFLFPTGGLAIDFQVAPVPVFVGVGLNYVNYGCEIEESYKYEGYRYSYSEKIDDAHSIQMPITASYHINVAPNLFVNPFFGGFMAYNFNDDFHEQFNYGLRFGCGMNYGRFTFDLGYDLGLANLADYDYKSKSGTFFVTIGFNWAGNR